MRRWRIYVWRAVLWTDTLRFTTDVSLGEIGTGFELAIGGSDCIIHSYINGR